MFKNSQYCEMVLIYRQYNRRKREGCRQYALKFLNEIHPSSYTIQIAEEHLRETGSIWINPQLKNLNGSIFNRVILGCALGYPELSLTD